jgi:hypothetical protein
MARTSPPSAVTRGELYALVVQAVVLIATATAAALLGVPGLRSYFRHPLGFALFMLVVTLVMLPTLRILVRRYYSRELSVRGIVEAIAITTLGSLVLSWIIQRIG